MNQRGFTLIEMLLSVAIIAMLAGLSLPVYQSFYNRNELDITAQQLASAVRRAHLYSRAGNQDSQWGVEIQEGAFILFKGATYDTRDPAHDETITFPTSTSVSSLGDLRFAKFTGIPTTTGSITLTNINNEARTVTLNAKGMVSY